MSLGCYNGIMVPKFGIVNPQHDALRNVQHMFNAMAQQTCAGSADRTALKTIRCRKSNFDHSKTPLRVALHTLKSKPILTVQV